jgi:hypothetical protein
MSAKLGFAVGVAGIFVFWVAVVWLAITFAEATAVP